MKGNEMTDRDRVAEFLMKRAPQIGVGDDPVGFLMANYAYAIQERNEAREEVERLRWTLKYILDRASFDTPPRLPPDKPPA